MHHACSNNNAAVMDFSATQQ